jgi:Domain of unknown function(DUF2779).
MDSILNIMSITLSKTDYMRWRECPKDAWIAIHNPDFYYSFEPNEFELALRETGGKVEQIARKLFPKGIIVEGRDKNAQQRTQELIDAKEPVIFQPVFAKDGFLAAADVLEFVPKTGGYVIHEIKSASSVKPEYLYDVAFQATLIRRCGLKIEKVYIIYLNKDYIRHGDLNVKELFVEDDLTLKVEEIVDGVAHEMEIAKAYLLSEAEPTGPCSCIYKGRSNHCTTFKHSNPQVPEYGVHDISRIGSSPKKLRELVDAGIFELDKIPTHIELSEIQRNQIRTYNSGDVVIQKTAIAAEFQGLQFPLYFIDYETHLSAIPLFDGWSPNKHVQFQYALHVVEALDAEPVRKDFLHAKMEDPDFAFVTSLQEHIGPDGSIIVWNKSFECSLVNKAIAARRPEYVEFLEEFNSRVYDLRDVFSKQYYVHKNLWGKTSIKKVLSVLTPELSYKELDIREGATASAAWPKIVWGEVDETERKRICDALLKYCGLDSYAMYSIWRALHSLL